MGMTPDYAVNRLNLLSPQKRWQFHAFCVCLNAAKEGATKNVKIETTGLRKLVMSPLQQGSRPISTQALPHSNYQ